MSYVTQLKCDQCGEVRNYEEIELDNKTKIKSSNMIVVESLSIRNELDNPIFQDIKRVDVDSDMHFCSFNCLTGFLARALKC